MTTTRTTPQTIALQQMAEGMRFDGAIKCSEDVSFDTAYGTFHAPEGDVACLVNRYNMPIQMVTYETPDVRFTGKMSLTEGFIPSDAIYVRTFTMYTRKNWMMHGGNYLEVTTSESRWNADEFRWDDV